MGPLLFLIYINDIVNRSSFCQFVLFADDTTLVASHYDLNTFVDLLNEDLKYVYEWLICNKLSLNVLKTKYLVFINRRNVKALSRYTLFRRFICGKHILEFSY